MWYCKQNSLDFSTGINVNHIKNHDKLNLFKELNKYVDNILSVRPLRASVHF